MAEQPAPEDQAREIARQRDLIGALNAQRNAPVKKERQESFWASFNRDDMKLFIVTIAGTVVANLLTVMVVAIAIILDRPRSVPLAQEFGNLLYVAVFIGAVTPLVIFRYRRTSLQRKVIAAIDLLVIFSAMLMVLLILLVLLGRAAGVK